MVKVKNQYQSKGLEGFQLLLEESLEALEELKFWTHAIAEGSYNTPEELERIAKHCQELRMQVDKNLMQINELSPIISRYFSQDDDLRAWYNLFREKLREAQDITFRAMHSLKASMEKLDNDMVRIRQKHKAIQGYGKHKQRGT